MLNKFIAGVSGGPDSMALLDKYQKQILAIAHVNYQKRDSSLRDEKIVLIYAKKHNIPCHILRVKKKDFLKFKSKNFQNVARLIRYNFYEKIISKYKSKTNTIILGHNYNDFLETAYIQKQKKSKSLFWGIRKKSTYKSFNIYRPLISKYKNELEKYCQIKNVPYGIDETNDMPIYERNKIRKIINSWSDLELKKFINEINKRNKKNLELNTVINKKYQLWSKNNYDVSFFNSQKEIHQFYLIYNFLREKQIENINTNKIYSIINFINSKKNGLYRLQNGIFLDKKTSYLLIKYI